jgi:hypothetical protein
MPLTLQEISDRIEINDLLVRYTVAIDTKDWKLLDTCFTADADVDYTTSGGIKGKYPEVRAWLEKALAAFDMTQHLITNTTLELAGDRASTTSTSSRAPPKAGASRSASKSRPSWTAHSRRVYRSRTSGAEKLGPRGSWAGGGRRP